MTISKAMNALFAIVSAIAGCSAYDGLGWKAKDYFADQNVVALCHAIEGRDVAAVERLVSEGVDVNAMGKDNMTPLMWAFPGEDNPCFRRLLELGADPNVKVTSRLNTHSHIRAGDSVTTLAANSAFTHFQDVMQHGGNPNQKSGREDPLLHVVIGGNGGNRMERVELLIEAGANLDQYDASGWTPAMNAVARGDFDVALRLLEAGARHDLYTFVNEEVGLQRLIHFVESGERFNPQGEHRVAYDKLIAFMEAKGESVEEAAKDQKRWSSWPNWDPDKIKELRQAEVAARDKKRNANDDQQ